MKKRSRNLMIAAGLSISLALSGCSANETSGEAEQTEKATPVKVDTIKKGNLSVKTEIIAKAVSESSVQVMPKMAGELIEVRVKKGDKVKKGQVLAVIDNKNQEIALEMEKNAAQNTKSQHDQALVSKKQAEAALKNAEIGVKQAELNLQKALDGQETGLESADDNLEQAQTGLNDAQLNYERMKILFENGAVSKQQLEQAESAVKQAQIAYNQAELQRNNTEKTTDIELVEQQVEQAKVALLNAEQQLELANVGIKQAEIGLETNQLRIEQAELQLDHSKIVATIDGEVTDINGIVGEIVSSSAPFTSIVDLDKMSIEARISANQLASFALDQEVDVEIPALHETFKAQITYISNIADEGGFYLLEAAIDNEERKIKPGMIAKVINEADVVEESLLVPTNAVIERGDEVYLYVIEEDRAVKTPIEIIRAQTELTAIKGEGLSEETIIVTKGQTTLSDGNKVNIIEEEQS